MLLSRCRMYLDVWYISHIKHSLAIVVQKWLILGEKKKKFESCLNWCSLGCVSGTNWIITFSETRVCQFSDEVSHMHLGLVVIVL